ncbi:C1 family peptidase [Burkholderia ubonensis]|uniref:C1 family peptidase n=1 Tax=Burkholderia ubonensis TaxID=101571 RepID=UPI0009B3D62A|nr:C1 family peptidase [Burkholderia ubonensis]
MIQEIVNFAATCGPARNQHRRGTCLAFASSDFNRHANNGDQPLSVDFLAHHAIKHMPDWKAGDGLSVSAAIAALHQPGQPKEEAYAYDPQDQGRPLLPVPAGIDELFKLFTSVASRRRLTPDQIEATIKSGKPVSLVLALSKSFFKPDGGIVAYATDYVPQALHAVLCVGLGTHSKANETHVLIRNSWGEAWGRSGHAWLPAQYLHTHLVDSFAL